MPGATSSARSKATSTGVARASGYVFVMDDLNKHMFVKRPDRRTKLIPISVR